PQALKIFNGYESEVECVAFSPDEKRLFSGSVDGTLRQCDLQTGEQIGKEWKEHTDVVCAVDVSETMVVSGSRDHKVILWNKEPGEVKHIFEGHQGTVQSVQFSPEYHQVVSGSFDTTVRLWHVDTG
ncbi:WD40-repeat-containing domain protein, partial [Melanogaster broomeanus]